MAKQLTVTLNINPAAAVRAGKTMVGETTLLLDEERLAELTPKQRETLAKHLAGESLPEPFKTHRVTTTYGDQLHRNAPPIAEATVETLALLLDHREVTMQKLLAECEQEHAEKRQRADKAVREALDNIVTVSVSLDRKGRVARVGQGVLQIEVSRIGNVDTTHCSPDVRESYRIAAQRCRQQELDLIQAAQPEVERIVAAEAAAQAAVAAQYEEQIARLPEGFRKRCEAGFASKSEESELLQALWIADAGYDVVEHLTEKDWYEREDPDGLTDAEFERLRAIEKEAPEGAKCTPQILYFDRGYRLATNEEYGDCDGEIKIPSGERSQTRAVFVEWERAGTPVSVALPLG